MILRHSCGGAQPNISESNITKLEIPVPPVDKQNEIVDYISSIRNKAKQLLNEAQSILKSVKIEIEGKIVL